MRSMGGEVFLFSPPYCASPPYRCGEPAHGSLALLLPLRLTEAL
jgi:hypothetical protein